MAFGVTNSNQAKALVIGSVVGAGVISSVDSVSRGQMPPARVFVGAFAAGLMLLALADVQPELAAGFGLVVITGAVLGQGIPAAKRLQQVLGQ